MSAWESSIVVDAWRIVHKRPVYADPEMDHATHMYGPLATYIVAPFIKTFGPDPRVPRYIAMAATLSLCCLGAALLSRGFRWRWLLAFFIFGLWYLQFYRIREWGTESRPDATSVFAAFVAMVGYYLSFASKTRTRALLWIVLATCSTILAFLFKQTSMMIAFIPPLAAILLRPPDFRVRVMLSLLPLAAVACTIAVLHSFSPWVYFYMVQVPKKYPVSVGNWMLALLEAIRCNTLFIAAFAYWLLQQHLTKRRNDLDAWLLLTILVTTIVGAAGRAKFGGFYNSLLLAYLAMHAFSARVLVRAIVDACQKAPDFRIMGTVAVAPALLVLVDISAMARTLNPGSLALTHGDKSFHKVISLAKKLPGTFVSPDDPIIALYAKAYAGRCGECELDAAGRDRTSGFPVPNYMLDEIRDADWILQVNASREPSIPAKILIDMGFKQTSDMLPSGSVYLLWNRSQK